MGTRGLTSGMRGARRGWCSYEAASYSKRSARRRQHGEETTKGCETREKEMKRNGTKRNGVNENANEGRRDRVSEMQGNRTHRDVERERERERDGV